MTQPPRPVTPPPSDLPPPETPAIPKHAHGKCYQSSNLDERRYKQVKDLEGKTRSVEVDWFLDTTLPHIEEDEAIRVVKILRSGDQPALTDDGWTCFDDVIPSESCDHEDVVFRCMTEIVAESLLKL